MGWENCIPDGQATRPQVAVLLAAFNGIKYIEAQISSIISQVDVDVTVFISVDRSSDGTESLVSQLAKENAKLVLLPFGIRFGAASPNFYRLFREVELGRFDYVSLADQDDIWYPHKLLRACRTLKEEGAFGYSSNVTAFWPTGRTKLVDKAQPQRLWDFLFEACGPGCTYVLRVDLALELQSILRRGEGEVKRVGYHDWLIYAFARSGNKPWVIDASPTMDYRQHANNQIGVNSGWRPYWGRARMILQGHGFEQASLIAGLVGASELPVVRRGLFGGRLGHLWLAFQAAQCRRKRIEQVWFFILCLIFAVVGDARQREDA